MNPKPVVPRKQADLDIQRAFDHYLAEAGGEVALRLIDALEQVITDIARHPAIGSPRYGHELNLPGLRHRPIRGFPHLVFYIELERHIEIWRVLHGHSDIPAWMDGEDVL